MNLGDHYTLLIKKLDEFIRKYYLNKIIRGALFFVAFLVSLYLVYSLTEYRFYFSPDIRKFFFYSFLLACGSLLYIWILNPLLKYYRLGKIIDHETAARIIGKHFGNVSDKLLNILQLKNQAVMVPGDLIEASIDQKIQGIRLVPFQKAVDITRNRKYLKFALPPLAVLVFIVFAAPNMLIDSNLRIIENNQHFARKAPFAFDIGNDKLEVVQYDDFPLELHMHGSVLPAEVILETPSGSFPMSKKSADTYAYLFNKVPSDIRFHFLASGFSSEEYVLHVIPKPSLLDFDVSLQYPSYTGKQDEVMKNTGDLLVPEGTRIQWIFRTENADKLEMFFPGKQMEAEPEGKSSYRASWRAMVSSGYKIGIANDRVYNRDTVSYMLSVVPDNYPQIQVQQFRDSTDDKLLYFLGDASDDYGFTKLNFHYSVESVQNGSAPVIRDEQTLPVPIGQKGNKIQFTHAFDLHNSDLGPGDRVEYYFEVWDNDGVHGPKSTRTPAIEFVIPSLKELQQMKDENNQQIKDKLGNVIDEIHDIQKQTDDLQQKFLEEKDLDWKDKKSLQDLLQRNMDVQKQVQDLKSEYKQNLQMQQEYLKQDADIMQKQDQLDKLFDQVMPDEMKDLMKQLQDMLDKLNKEQSKQQMDEMKMDNKQLETELDRMLELFKQLEMQQKMQETVDKLQDLSKQQDSLSRETGDRKSDTQKDLGKQQDIHDQFNDIKKDVDDLDKLNQDLENKKDLEDAKQDAQKIDKNLQDASQQLSQGNKKQASQSQKNASQQMQQMAQKMQSQMSQDQMEQQMEDMSSLRQLLDNLIKLSVDQESLMDDVQQTRTNNPKYVDLMNKQQQIREDSRMVEDSLNALAKRVFQISSFITREMDGINHNLDNSIDQLSDRQVGQANMYQQLVMTGYNNLALMLDEVMQQMQQQMAQQMPGNSMCEKPGGNSSLPTMSEMQKQLNESLKKLQGEMPQGEKTGGQEGMNQQLAEMARQQAAIREAIQKMAEQLGGGNTEDGQLAKQLQQIADKMDKTEEDIVNKNITQETLKRQQDILTRLLDAEDAERQRKTDNERQAETAKEVSKRLPPAIEEYLKERNAELDIFKTVSPDLKPFYKNLVEDYFRSMSGSK